MILEAIVSRVASSAIVGAAKVVWRNWRRPLRALQTWRGERTARKAAVELAAARQRVLDRAATGVGSVTIAMTGTNPTVIKHASGRLTYRYPSQNAEYEGMSRGISTPWNSYHGKLPKVLDDWTLEECNDWLEKNPAKDET